MDGTGPGQSLSIMLDAWLKIWYTFSTKVKERLMYGIFEYFSEDTLKIVRDTPYPYGAYNPVEVAMNVQYGHVFMASRDRRDIRRLAKVLVKNFYPDGVRSPGEDIAYYAYQDFLDDWGIDNHGAATIGITKVLEVNETELIHQVDPWTYLDETVNILSAVVESGKSGRLDKGLGRTILLRITHEFEEALERLPNK